MDPNHTPKAARRTLACLYFLALIVAVSMVLPVRTALAATVTHKDADSKEQWADIYVVEDPGKEYDGTPVANPAVKTASAGEVSYTYYDKDGGELGGPPQNVGTYTVVATVSQTNLYVEASSEPYEFAITPRATACTLEMELDPSDNAVAVLTATVHKLLESDGTVAFKYLSTQYPQGRTTEPQEVTRLADGVYGVRFDASNIIASDYKVQAIYTPSEKGNYKESTSEELSGHKDYADRHILDEKNHFAYVKTYGDPQFSFTLSTDHPTPEQNDEWDWRSITSDVYDSQFSVEHTITLLNANDGLTHGMTMPSVAINHVGEEVLNVGLVDGHSSLGNDYMYNPANHSVTVSVLPKDLMVTTPSATKEYDGEPLTALDGTCTGLANDETLGFQVTGSQTDAGSSNNTYAITWNTGDKPAQEANYHVIESLGTLTVTPRSTTLDLQLSEEGANATATARVGNFASTDASSNEVAGQVTFTFAKSGDMPFTESREITYANPVATIIGEGVAAGEYKVTATFVPSEGNYQPSTSSVTRNTNLQTREIEGARLIKKTYGDEPFSLGLSVSETTGNDTWSYEFDSDVVDIDPNGNVTIKGAGYKVVHARVHDNNGVYEDAHAYAVIVVAPKSITVQTESATRAYDGAPLTAGGTCEGLVGNDNFDVTGSRIAAGSSWNTYSITPDGAESNYAITESLGTLKVLPAATTVDLKLSQRGPSATATATIGGLHDEQGTVGTVTFAVNGVNKASPTVTRGEDGKCVVSVTLDDVPEGYYTVTAAFEPDGDANVEDSLAHNYLPSTAEAAGRKGLEDRSIVGERRVTKTYGDANFSLGLSLSEGAQGTDAWSYDIIFDSRNIEALGLGPSIALSNTDGGSANVAINHAGTVVIRVTVADGKPEGERVYADAIAYVVVDVVPAQLKVTSRAYNKEDTNKTPVTSVRYGQVDTLAYDLEFDGLLPGDSPGAFTTVDGRNHGTLAALPLVSTIGASETPYQVGIARVAPEGADAGPFFSCNYDITYDTTSYAVTVTKAPLAIQVLDATGVYRGDEPTYEWAVASNQSAFAWEGQTCAGLASWDTAESIFTEEPTVALDTSTTDGKPFSELDPGTYNNALVLSGGASENYGIVSIPGKLVVSPADLSDTDRFTVTVKDATYNAEAQVAQVTVVDRAFGPEHTLEQDAQFRVVYLGNHTDAGTAHIEVVGMGGNYAGRQILSFEIDKATVRIDTDSAVKVYDGKALTAPGTVLGILGPDAYTFSTTGKQTDPGVSRNTYELKFDDPAKANNYAIAENVGTLTVLAPDTLYYCESGANGVWTKGSKDALEFVFKRIANDATTFDHFEGLEVDGKSVDAEGYTARRGSVVVDLPAPYLETLDVGEHALTAKFDDGNPVTVDFTVRKAASSPTTDSGDGKARTHASSRTSIPRTGDPLHVAWLAALAFSGLGMLLGGIAMRFRRQQWSLPPASER